MNRRGFMGSLLAGGLIGGKDRQVQEKQEGLRFNGNTIEVWTGDKWQTVIKVKVEEKRRSPCVQTLVSANSDPLITFIVERKE